MTGNDVLESLQAMLDLEAAELDRLEERRTAELEERRRLAELVAADQGKTAIGQTARAAATAAVARLEQVQQIIAHRKRALVLAKQDLERLLGQQNSR